jgi:hypothetical protein
VIASIEVRRDACDRLRGMAGTVHKLMLPERATREFVRAGLAHEHLASIRLLWNPTVRNSP